MVCLVLVIALVLSAALTPANAWHQRPNPVRLRFSSDSPVFQKTIARIASVILAVSLLPTSPLLLMQGQSAMAADLDDFTTSAPTQTKRMVINEFDYASSLNEEAGMQRKARTVEAAVVGAGAATGTGTGTETGTGTGDDGGRYKASLAKEKAKSEAISKKSLAERR